jgi:hypothetical protein
VEESVDLAVHCARDRERPGPELGLREIWSRIAIVGEEVPRSDGHPDPMECAEKLRSVGITEERDYLRGGVGAGPVGCFRVTNNDYDLAKEAAPDSEAPGGCQYVGQSLLRAGRGLRPRRSRRCFGLLPQVAKECS